MLRPPAHVSLRGVEITPPPAMSSRVEELGDRLVVNFRPAYSKFGLAFPVVWLVFWTFGGIAAIGALLDEPNWGGRAFLLLWLCGWAVGEVLIPAMIVWQLFGREQLIVSPQAIEFRRSVGRFSLAKRYPAPLVGHVAAVPVPTDEDEPDTDKFCLQISYRGEKVRIGAAFDKREAEELARLVDDRVHPRPRSGWWGDEPEHEARPDIIETPAVAVEPTAKRSRALRLVRASAFPPLVVAVLVAAWAMEKRNEEVAPATSTATTSAATTAKPGLPSRDDFERAEDYAAAVTRYTLRAGRTLVGSPKCDGTWKRWRCTVRARPTSGPFAATQMTYFCESDNLSGFTCGPVTPGAPSGPPQAEDFDNARAFAVADTRYSLRGARTRVLGKIDCGARVTWTNWRCTVVGVSKDGPFAGVVMTYFCELQHVDNPNGTGTRGLLCGPVDPPRLAP